MTAIKALLFSILSSVLMYIVYITFVGEIAHMDMFLLSLITFILLFGLHFLISAVVTKRKQNLILPMTMFNILIKIVVAFLVVYLYVKWNSPGDKAFILPFIATYLCFTIFETYYLSKLAESG